MIPRNRAAGRPRNKATGRAIERKLRQFKIPAVSNGTESVMEGAMGTSNKKTHDAKIKKLRSFLDNNDKSFVYDFDQFAKTIFGAKITESVLTENYIHMLLHLEFQQVHLHFLEQQQIVLQILLYYIQM